MLTTSKQMIQDAQKGGYAIGSFNTSDLEITRAIVEAGEKLKSPLIIQTSEKAIAYAGLEEIAGIVKTQAKKASVPIALHLDHGGSLQMISHAIAAGYTSVMFDGSKYSLNENEVYTRQAVLMAHKNNIPCEGELGAIRKVGEDKKYTDPNEVYQFIKNTGVDYLAIAIGSAHGISSDEKINFKLLEEIRKKTKIPLVLHGASGIKNEEITHAIKLGICKINIDTDIRYSFLNTLKNAQNLDAKDPRDIMKEVMKNITNLITEKILLFKSNGKGI